MDATGIDKVVLALSGNAQALLYYSLAISKKYLPTRPPRLFSIRAVVAYFPFASVCFEGDESNIIWRELNIKLDHVLRPPEGINYRVMTAELTDSIERRIKPNVVEKKLFHNCLASIDLRAVADAQNTDDDEIYNAFDQHVEFSHGIAPKSLSKIAKLFQHAESEPFDRVEGKMAYLNEVARLVGLTKPCSELTTENECAFEADGLLSGSNRKIVLLCMHSEVELDAQISFILARQADARLLVFLICALGDDRRLQKQVACKLSEYHTVTLDSRAVLRAHFRSPGYRSLAEVILKSLPLRLVSPYSTSGPSRTTFFGRGNEIEQILSSKSQFYVLGPRKIGKTSLLEKVAFSVNEGQALANTVAICVDAQKDSRLEYFQMNIHSAFCRAAKHEVAALDPGRNFFSEFAGQINKSVQDGLSLIFLIDEIDVILNLDGFQIVENFFRSIANRQQARIVVFGYTRLSERIKDNTSAFYNLFESIILGPLDVSAAIDLITQPMEKIGVRYESESTPKQIVEACSAIPWLIQSMCQQLLEQIGNQRVITNELVESTATSQVFSQLLLATIREDRSLGPLPQLILHIFAKLDRLELGEELILREVQRVVYDIQYSDVVKALLHLTSTYLLRRTASDRYRYFVDRQRVLLRNTVNLEMSIEQLAKDYRLDES